MRKAEFSIGQIIVHNKFKYRGVIFDVDANYGGTQEWYDRVAKSRPPKNKPWYHVLVDGQLMTTYVAERHLDLEANPEPITHPFTKEYFSCFKGGVYQNYRAHN